MPHFELTSRRIEYAVPAVRMKGLDGIGAGAACRPAFLIVVSGVWQFDLCFNKLIQSDPFFQEQDWTFRVLPEHESGVAAGVVQGASSLTLWRKDSILSFEKMQRKSPHEKSASAKLTFVVLSDAEKPSRSFKATKLQLTLVVLFGIVAVGGASIFAAVDTPLGELILPSYFSSQAEQLQKVRVLETKVDAVQSQLTYLAAYNIKLRRALGDTAVSDTSLPPVAPNIPVAGVVQSTPNSSYDEAKNYAAPIPAQAKETVAYKTVSSLGMDRDVFPLMMPVQGFVTRGVNYAIQHYGIDISAQEGAPIVAPAPGEVVFSDWTLTGGNTLIIAHAGDFMTVYKHCERILVSVGAKVSRGEAIALVGSTGTTSTGPHLHFELWRDGKNLNPENYLLTKN